ncbi:type II toxin-antitoxin system VapC family toxin [uncultured Enterovirga sp.]|uniref:type II toxin-antitoxin system VapC family toxin n=1 Tax=uncultured Enterovirga sp. TaxID=2026352 RepID=UPI0035CB0127
MKAYADTSVLLPLFVPDALSAKADALLNLSETFLIVSDFTVAEFMSALSRKVRMREVSAASAGRLAANFDAWLSGLPERVTLQPEDVATATAYLRRFDLTLRTPDALHVALAHRHRATLATLDVRLAADAGRLGISTLVS